ncbi:general secretion pathway protein H [Thioflavicoccus mobilis 8321]|uniref:Type II secretion system protein H n=1 Tax=Thioflavicoccus mobilis 8321 TaxID=765912 RepID=L0GUD6_9GAMM|nr:GspH/FimT family pseudopilin [Thioflavicoccus mobilis]AGA88924.1 general secretion pathway protein H [Thioflavicoccus mobilis 8321]
MTASCSLRPRVRGFTLIELLVVLALMGAILAITPPLIGKALPGVELKAAARRTAAGLRLARAEAIRSGRDAAFILDVEAHRFRVDGDYRAGQIPADIALRVQVAERETSADDVGAIRFFPDGSSTGGVVVLARDDRGYEVGVNWLTGRIRMVPCEDCLR